jgi:hypothetical protein
MYDPPCAFYDTPTPAQIRTFKIEDPDIVFGCKNRQGEGGFFFIPVEGGAVRVRVCPKHSAWLEQHHDLVPDGHPRPGSPVPGPPG